MLTPIVALAMTLFSSSDLPTIQDQDSRVRTPKIYNDPQMVRAVEIIQELKEPSPSDAALVSELVRLCGFDIVNSQGEIIQPAITTPKVEIGIDQALIEMAASQYREGGQISMSSFATVFELGLAELKIKESAASLMDNWISTACFSKLAAERVTNQVVQYLSVVRFDPLTGASSGRDPALDSLQILLLASGFGEDIAGYGQKDELFASAILPYWRPRSKFIYLPQQTNPTPLPKDLSKIYKEITANLITLAQFDCKFSVGPGKLPLIRTITTVAGESKNITGALTYNLTKAFAGIDKLGLSTSYQSRPAAGSSTGKLSDLKVKWDTSKLFSGFLGPTSPLNTMTSTAGEAKLQLSGKAQKKNLDPKRILTQDSERDIVLETNISFTKDILPKIGLAPTSELAKVLGRVQWDKKWHYPVLARNRAENGAEAVITFNLESSYRFITIDTTETEETKVSITYHADSLNTLSFGDANPMFTLATGDYSCEVKSSFTLEAVTGECVEDTTLTTKTTEGKSNAKFGDGYNDSQVFFEIDPKKKQMKATLMAPYTGSIEIFTKSKSNPKPIPPKISVGTFSNPFWGYDQQNKAGGAEFVMSYTAEKINKPDKKGTIYRAKSDRLPPKLKTTGSRSKGFAKLAVYLFVPDPN